MEDLIREAEEAGDKALALEYRQKNEEYLAHLETYERGNAQPRVWK
jgi:hypothetical protein